MQKSKTRVIDDFSVCGLNASCGSKEKFKIQAIDELAAYLSCVFTSSLNGQTGYDIFGKTFDLKSAYRQFGLSKSEAELARVMVMVLDTDNLRPKLLGMRTLPFGAVGSVGGFLRVSYALWFIGVASLKLAWTGFYDDCIFITSRQLQNSAVAASHLFDLLGIVDARDGDKSVKFDKKYKALGLQVDLNESLQHKAYIGYTSSSCRRTFAFVGRYHIFRADQCKTCRVAQKKNVVV